MVAALREFGKEIGSVKLEAGILTQWLAYGLRAAGFKPVVLEARQMNATLSAMHLRKDRNDARGIAQTLRTGWYRPMHVKSIESHHTRTILAARRALLRKCIDLENEVQGVLKVFGIKVAAGVRHNAFDAVVRGPIEGNKALAQGLIPLLDVRLELYRAFLEMDRRVKAIAHADPICKHFESRSHGRALGPACRRQHHHDAGGQILCAESVGAPADEEQGTQAGGRRRCPQARRHSAHHVERRHGVLRGGG